MLKNYTQIRLVTNDYENEGVSKGNVGYIVETYEDGDYEVEFSDPGGRTIALLALRESELEATELSVPPSDAEGIVILLEPDVRKYFPDSDAVNRALRSLIPLQKQDFQAEAEHG